MSEVTIKTIETLPLVEQPTEEASLIGWNDGQTVRMPVSAVGGEGMKGIAFTYEYEEGGSSASMSIEPLVSIDGTYVLSCNYGFDECFELLLAGSPVTFIDTNRGTVTSAIYGNWTEASDKSVLDSAPAGNTIYLTCMHMDNPNFYITYNADELYGEYEATSN